ncbi:MAG: hypothetical protein ACW960_15075, partial [Candidatus Thorarchaeota archaeon]
APIEFTYKRDIVVDSTKVDADLTDFPMLIDIYDTDLKNEIELFDQSFNSTHAHLVAWVKTDLSSTVDTNVTMHYGNPQAPNQENPNGVWNQNYMGVWHLGETAGGSGAFKDSTSNRSNRLWHFFRRLR